MSSRVIEAHRTEPSPASIEHDCAACYLDAIAAAFAGALREVAPGLVIPRRANADRARRVLDCFIDTATGFALGAIANHLMTGMRRWFGEDGTSVMRAALHGWPAFTRVETEGDVHARLHVRFSLAQAQVRALVEAVPNRPMTGMMFGVLAKDDALEHRIADQLALGWRVYSAAVTTRRYPSLNPLWQAWVWQLDGKPVLTRDETELAGYITLVR